MKTKDLHYWTLVAGTLAATATTAYVADLAAIPQIRQLLELVGLESAQEISTGLVIAALGAAAIVGAHRGAGATKIWLCIAGLTVCVVAVSVKVVRDDLRAKDAAHSAAMADYEARLAVWQSMVDATTAKFDGGHAAHGEKCPVKRSLTKLMAERPQQPPAPATGWLDMAIAVVGRAGSEAITMTVLELIAMRLGRWWRALLPVYRREEEAEASARQAAPEPAKREVSDETRQRISEGLRRYHERRRAAAAAAAEDNVVPLPGPMVEVARP